MNCRAIRAAALATTILVVSADAAIGQVCEPEYMGNYIALVGSSCVQLERTKSEVHSEASFMGIAGVDVEQRYPGSASPVRFKRGQAVSFLLRVQSPDEDPQTYVVFNRLATKDGIRALSIVTKKSMFSGINANQTASAVPFTTRKRGASIIEITSTAPLLPGEYVLSMQILAPSIAEYQFGVDP